MRLSSELRTIGESILMNHAFKYCTFIFDSLCRVDDCQKRPSQYKGINFDEGKIVTTAKYTR